MIHDPLCPYRPAPPDEYAPFEATVPCTCDLIAKADERGATRALDKARQAVAAIEMGGEHFWCVGFRDGIAVALTEIAAMQGES